MVEKVVFDSQKVALDFLVQVANKLKERLNSIQTSVVKDVREAAHAAWEKRIITLIKYIHDREYLSDSKDITNLLQADLMTDLEQLSSDQIHDKVSQLITDKIQKPKGESRFTKFIFKLNPFLAQQLAQEKAVSQYQKVPTGQEKKKKKTEEHSFQGEEILEVLTDIRLRNLSSADQAPTSNSPDALGQRRGSTAEKLPPTAKDLTEQDAAVLYVKSKDQLGFLISAPALSSAAQCPVTTHMWPFLKKSGVQLPIRLNIKEAISKYDDYTIATWHSVMEGQCRDSLDGAIDMSSRLGHKVVKETIEKQLDLVEGVEKQREQPLGDNMEERLIFTQANFVGAFAAVDELIRILKSNNKPRDRDS
jgi:hypothetical protein